jgi:hypothetical protein
VTIEWGELRSAVAAQEWDRALALAADSPEALGYVRDVAAHRAAALVHSNVRAAIDAGNWLLAILWARDSAWARGVVTAHAAAIDAEERLEDIADGLRPDPRGPLWRLRDAWAWELGQRATRLTGSYYAAQGLSLAETEREWAAWRESTWVLDARDSKALERRMEAASAAAPATISWRQHDLERRTVQVWVTTRHPELWLHLAKPPRRYEWLSERSWLLCHRRAR